MITTFSPTPRLPAAASVTALPTVALDAVPHILTPRLRLRDVRDSDAGALFAYLSDAETTRYIELRPFAHISEARELIRAWQANYALGRQLRWGITLEPSGALIGSVGFDRWVPHSGEADLGYELARPYWGQGLMSEAVRAVVAFGFCHLGLRRIEAWVWPENTASVRLLERQGFRPRVPYTPDAQQVYALARDH